MRAGSGRYCVSHRVITGCFRHLLSPLSLSYLSFPSPYHSPSRWFSLSYQGSYYFGGYRVQIKYQTLSKSVFFFDLLPPEYLSSNSLTAADSRATGQVLSPKLSNLKYSMQISHHGLAVLSARMQCFLACPFEFRIVLWFMLTVLPVSPSLLFHDEDDILWSINHSCKYPLFSRPINFPSRWSWNFHYCSASLSAFLPLLSDTLTAPPPIMIYSSARTTPHNLSSLQWSIFQLP